MALTGKVNMKLFNICLLFILLSSCHGEPSIRVLWNDFQARQEIKSEKYEDALTRYFDLLETDGGQPATHSNIGVLLSKMQKPDDALKSLQHALELAGPSDAKSQFIINYNLGAYFGAQKKVEEALSHYQAALEIVPTSIETKTNIELLIQQQQDQKDKKDQKDKDGKGDGENKPDPKNDPEKNGDKDKDSKDNKNPKDNKDEKKDPKDKDGEGKDKKQDQPRQNSPKYQPRPFKGDQLSEGDVKKILGELKNQEQKIRANFDKKEKGKSSNNEKDW